MTARQYLSRGYTATEKITELQKQIARLGDEMTRLSSAVTDGSKVQSTPPKDPMGDRVVEIVDKITVREIQLARWEDVLFEVEDALNGLECVTCSKVLHGRYVRGLTLEEVGAELGYSVHQCRRYHTVGLAEIEIGA